MSVITERVPTEEEVEGMTEENGWVGLCKIVSPGNRTSENFPGYDVGYLYEVEAVDTVIYNRGLYASEYFVQCRDCEFDETNIYVRVLLHSVYVIENEMRIGDKLFVTEELSFDEAIQSLSGEICVGADKLWYQDGKLHRDNDQPAVIRAYGEKNWYREGNLHREGGPAVVTSDGSQMWYREGILHRENGPAIVWSNGPQEWYENGVKQ